MRIAARFFLPALPAAALAACLSCSSIGAPAAGLPGPPSAVPLQGTPAAGPVPALDPASGAPGAPASLRDRLLEGAGYVMGKSRLVVRGKSFPYDCTGTVRAIYWYAGIDLARRFQRYGGNGVKRLYRTLEDLQLLYHTTRPVPGDLIFWDNTYDRNGDGQWNDPLTHVGMVVRVSRDGLIEFVHLNYNRGILIEYLNLLDPDTHQVKERGVARLVNSPLRLQKAGRPHPDRWLASHLYRRFGKAYLSGL